MRSGAKCAALGLGIVVGGLGRAEPASADALWNLKAEKQNPPTAECMGIAGGANGDEVNTGAGIVVWDCNSADDQIWSGVANAQANPVERGMPVIMWERTPSDDQVWCVHPSPPPIFIP
jgi:hypothetical protein